MIRKKYQFALSFRVLAVLELLVALCGVGVCIVMVYHGYSKYLGVILVCVAGLWPIIKVAVKGKA